MAKTNRMAATLGAIVLGVALSLASPAEVGTASGPSNAPRAREQAALRATSTALVPQPALDRALQSDLEAYLARQSGLYGVALRDLETGQTVLIDSDREFLSASTYKVLVMYRVYQQIERGALSPADALTITAADATEEDGWIQPGETTTVGNALEAMITVSSNNAAHALTRRVGGWGSILGAARELGMSGTTLRGGYFRTTPSDMLAFFEALAEGRLVSARASREMRALLARQTVNDRIPALLPASATVAHKTGELPGVRNDVGIVSGPNGRYAIAVFGESASTREATRVIAEVARRAYARYAG